MDDKGTPTGEQFPNVKDTFTSMEVRLRKLEQTKATIIGGTIVGAVLITGYFGFTSFHQLPQTVNDLVPQVIEKYVDEELPRFAEDLEAYRESAMIASEEAATSAEKANKIIEGLQNRSALLRIESGDIDLHHGNVPELRRTDTCPEGRPGLRGAVGERMVFSTPFSEPPRVVLSLNLIDHVIDSGLINNLRIDAAVTEVDTRGFNYNLHTWCNTDIWSVRISWIAYGH